MVGQCSVRKRDETEKGAGADFGSGRTAIGGRSGNGGVGDRDRDAGTDSRDNGGQLEHKIMGRKFNCMK